ncbi:MAG: alanine racemase [Bacteroidetes bacterium HGW-Bacteroidetes-6]|jgi:alanine racemase|nr:MAG: alanine racemase [Bacteroidetes bacterium HGW-Bacteroidetes-6]
MSETSVIELSRESVNNNIRFLRKKYGSKVRISSVLKANAYGHGIEQMAPMLEDAGIDHFSVFDFSEAMRVKNSLKTDASVMIMGWISPTHIKKAIFSGFEFYIFNLDRLRLALKYAQLQQLKAKIHIEAETGMNRSGLNQRDLLKVIEIIKSNPKHFEIMGFCSHLSGAESISNYMRIQQQIRKYHKMLTTFTSSGLTPQFRHLANSAASLVYPKTRLDLVRVGILQYGFWPSTETFIHYISRRKDKSDPLLRILKWKSRIMSIKEVKTGEFVGYGISFLAQSNIRTALIPIGYSCGYSRSLSNKGQVLIDGMLCNVIGVVNMNMIIADITLTNNANIGDEVVIIGKQENHEIKVSSFSDSSNMLNYEVLTHLPKNITRVVV